MKISVVIPLYNKKDTIIRALYSVFNQTVKPEEIIVVNDGSTDGSEQIVADLAHPLVKLIRQPNQGVSAARNRGIEAALGDWIAFLDADDEWLPGFLETIGHLKNMYPTAIGYGTSYYKKYQDNLLQKSNLRRLQFKSKTGVLKNYFEVCNYSDPPIWTSAVCIEKMKLLNLGGFPKGIKAGEDLLTWARLSQRGNFAYSITPMAIYYQSVLHPGSDPPTKNDYVGAELKKITESVDSKIEKRELKKYIGKWHKMRAALFLITGKNRDSVKEIKNSVLYSGLTFKVLIYLILIMFPAGVRSKVLFTKRQYQIQ